MSNEGIGILALAFGLLFLGLVIIVCSRN